MKIFFWIRRWLRKLGVDVKYFPGSEQQKLKRFLLGERINVIVDVGANVGQFAESMWELGYKGTIISFEPQAEAYNTLRRKAARSRCSWRVFQYGLGDKNTTALLNISANSASSSLLEMLDEHEKSAPHSRVISNQQVEVRTLDSVVEEHCETSDRLFLKIDTQGYEEKVLNGAVRVLDRVKGIQLEMSLVPLYNGELLFDDMRRKLEGLGFTLSSIEPGFSDKSTGKLLQVDGLFFRISK